MMNEQNVNEPIPYVPTKHHVDFLTKYVGPLGAVLWRPDAEKKFMICADRRLLNQALSM